MLNFERLSEDYEYTYEHTYGEDVESKTEGGKDA